MKLGHILEKVLALSGWMMYNVLVVRIGWRIVGFLGGESQTVGIMKMSPCSVVS